MDYGLNRKKSFRKEVQKMKPETDAKKIKDGMVFYIGKEFYLKLGKNAVRLDIKPFYEAIIFEDFIRENENEIKYIFKSNGKPLCKKEEN